MEQMDLTFNLFDLISLATLFSAVIASFWKLSNRMSLTENRVHELEKDVNEQKIEFRSQLSDIDRKLDKKLDNLGEKIERLISEVARINGQHDRKNH